ncbi:CHAT domain-containing protein [Aequorivita sp. SDUM287046]|uniref:CHAT domain-containing protein n=2 Tax=Aequorivita aurantiaca TaxID=3053356 RepID=A0ABT8DFN0_9FLAO|nr:CHAT domain-containing protein [Aequorivita aurantiaca]
MDEFSQAEILLKNAYKNGDYSGWKRADSIFHSMVLKNKFASDEQEILSHLYIIKINSAKDPEKDLKVLNNLIVKFSSKKNNYPELFEKLLFFKERARFKLNKPDAEDAVLRIIDEQLKSKNPDKFIVSWAYDLLGNDYYRKKDFGPSVEFFKKSIPYFNYPNTNQLYINALQSTGAAYYNVDKIDSSLFYMKKAYREIKKTRSKNYKRLGELAFNIGIINQGKTGEYIEAEDFLKEAISFEILAHGEESPILITYYSLLADNFYFLKDIEQAEFYANKAYFLATEIIKTESVYLRSLAAMSLSKVYTSKKQFNEARKLMDTVLEESIAFFGEQDKFTSQAYIDRAMIEIGAKNYKDAEPYLLQSAKVSEAIDRVYSRHASYAYLYELYLQNKEFEKALKYSKMSKNLMQQHLENDYKVKIITDLYIAEAYLGLKQLDSARVILEEVAKNLPLYENVSGLKIQLLALENAVLLENYKQNGSQSDLEKAYGNINKLIKQLIAGKRNYNYQESKIFYSKSIVPYIDKSLEICHIKYGKDKNPEVLNTIFKLMEINKSSILLDGITDFKLKTQKGIPETVMEDEAKTKKNLLAVNETIDKIKTDTAINSRKLSALYDKQLALNNRIDSIEKHLENEFPDYYNSRNLSEAKSLDFYQTNILRKNQCIVEYYLSDERLYRLVISKNEINFKEIPNSKNIIAQVENLMVNLLQREQIDDLRNIIGTSLLPIFADSIEEIIFIVDGSLSQLPFEILDYNNTYLLQNYHISYAGSLQLYQEQVEIHRRERINVDWLGFAPDYKDNFLSANKEEVQMIGNLMEGKYSLGPEATKQNFLDLGSQASILHLATHTSLDKANPMLNKMIFYDNGKDPFELTASEIYGLKLQSDLAVLSSCETGGGNYENDGIMSMSRAFAYAGVPSTVMSLWKVPDAQTSIIMINFYKNLEKGQNKNEALANAKLHYLENVKQPELKHPYYWAGFVVSGDISPIKYGFSWWWYVLLAGIILIVIFILFIRKNQSNFFKSSNDSF